MLNNIFEVGRMKKFKTESQRVLDIMINSIYTNREIFLRELLSNASDAIDKLYYKSLTENLGFSKGDFQIKIVSDEVKKTLKIIDNGIGMTADELEENLGVIAKSGSLDFKKNTVSKEDINIIGQFGVGFYSSFMVSDRVEVLSKAYGSEDANIWVSSGSEGYTLSKASKDSYGTEITMYIKADTEEDKFSEYLHEHRIKELVKKYSDYVRYPIKMDSVKTKEADADEEKKAETIIEEETLNSMIPLWKKRKVDIKEEDYNEYYKNTFYDYENPLKVIHTSVEGAVSYNSVLYIPAKAPYNYYSKNYEKGLKLYNNDIMIMEKCSELLPDYFSFVKGVVDSDLALNISRETIQHNYQLKKIATNIEKKIKNELSDMLTKDREKYEKFFKEFGSQIKYGIYEGWGVNKDELKDLIMFQSLNQNKMVTLKEYFTNMPENQKNIYYATGKSVNAIKSLPQSEKVIDAGFDILCFMDDVDEFVVKIMNDYEKKEFKSIASGDLGINSSDDYKENDKDKEILALMKEALGNEVAKVRLSNRLKSHPVCLSSEGELSIEMEKVLSAIPNQKSMKAEKVLEINNTHSIYSKIVSLYDTDKDAVKDYARILLIQAKLIEGLPIENPSDYADLICKKLSV